MHKQKSKYIHRFFTASLFLLLVLAFIEILTPNIVPEAKATITGVSPPASGTWTINADTVVTNEDLIINGSIQVNNWYKLTLVNSTLRMNNPSNLKYGIDVQITANFTMQDSKILNYTNYYYYFWVYGWADWDGFEIRGAGRLFDTNKNSSVYFGYREANIRNGVVHELGERGLLFVGDNNIVNNVTIYDIRGLATSIAFGIVIDTASSHNSFSNIKVYNSQMNGIVDAGNYNTWTNIRAYDLNVGIDGYAFIFGGGSHDNILDNGTFYKAGHGVTSTGNSYNNIIKNSLVYNTQLDSFSTDFSSHNITFDNLQAHDTGITFGFGAGAYNITLKNSIFWNANATNYGAVGIWENETNIVVRNVTAYNSAVGLRFDSGSEPYALQSDILIEDSNFYGNTYDVLVSASDSPRTLTLSNIQFLNTFYTTMNFTNARTTGQITSKWNSTAFGSGYSEAIHTGISNEDVGMSAWSFNEISGILTYTAYAPTSAVSTTKIYVGTKGQPKSISGATSWVYDSGTKIITLSVTHSSPATIQAIWSAVPEPLRFAFVGNMWVAMMMLAMIPLIIGAVLILGAVKGGTTISTPAIMGLVGVSIMLFIATIIISIMLSSLL